MKTVIDNGNGTKTVVALQDGALVTGTVQDCTPVAERAKALHNIGFTGSKDMKLAASIPFVVIEKYCNDHGITYEQYSQDKTHWKRLLTDPANAAFRIWKGAL